MVSNLPELSRVIDQVLTARADKTSLEILGGGTKRFYGEKPCGEPLDLRPLAGICSHEPSELVVTARAGTPLAELEAALLAHGQYLPFEPPSFSLGGTVGGMVAAGLAGPARASSGAVRDFVLGATVLNGRGELLSFGGQVMKNVAGYDVARLLAGSLGVLGVICEVSLKVLPVPPATLTLAFEHDEAAALSALNGWASQPLPINATAWHEGRLLVRLRGAEAAVRAARVRLGGTVLEHGEALAWWEAVRNHRHAFFSNEESSLWRLSVPATAAPLALPGQLIEWGGALRWWRTNSAAEEVRAMAAKVAGHATLFRGPQCRDGVFAPLSGPLMRIHRELKQSFDPDGVFNVGRLYPDL